MTLNISEYFIPQQLTACRLSPTGNVSGTYYNGLNNNGLGSTITTNSATLTADGELVVNNDSLLLTNQTSGFENGIYVVSGVGSNIVLKRRSDFESPSQMVPGFFVPVSAGAVNAGSIFTLLSPQVTQVGVSEVEFKASTGSISISSVNLVNSGLNIYNPASTFLNHIVPTSAITAGRQFSLITGDQNTTLNLTAAPNFAPSAYGATLVSSATKFVARTALGFKEQLQTGLPITLSTFFLNAFDVLGTDLVFVSLVSSPNPAYIIGVGPIDGGINLTFNTAPGANSIVSYVAFTTV